MKGGLPFLHRLFLEGFHQQTVKLPLVLALAERFDGLGGHLRKRRNRRGPGELVLFIPPRRRQDVIAVQPRGIDAPVDGDQQLELWKQVFDQLLVPPHAAKDIPTFLEEDLGRCLRNDLPAFLDGLFDIGVDIALESGIPARVAVQLFEPAVLVEEEDGRCESASLVHGAGFIADEHLAGPAVPLRPEQFGGVLDTHGRHGRRQRQRPCHRQHLRRVDRQPGEGVVTAALLAVVPAQGQHEQLRPLHADAMIEFGEVGLRQDGGGLGLGNLVRQIADDLRAGSRDVSDGFRRVLLEPLAQHGKGRDDRDLATARAHSVFSFQGRLHPIPFERGLRRRLHALGRNIIHVENVVASRLLHVALTQEAAGVFAHQQGQVCLLFDESAVV